MTLRQALGLTEILQARGVPATTLHLLDGYGTAYLHGRVVHVCKAVEDIPLDLLSRPYNGRPGEDVWRDYIMPHDTASRIAEVVRRAHWPAQVATFVERGGAGVVCDDLLQTPNMALDRALERL